MTHLHLGQAGPRGPVLAKCCKRGSFLHRGGQTYSPSMVYWSTGWDRSSGRQEEWPSLQQARRAPREAVVPAARGGGGVACCVNSHIHHAYRPPLPGKEAQSSGNLAKVSQLGMAGLQNL